MKSPIPHALAAPCFATSLVLDNPIDNATHTAQLSQTTTIVEDQLKC
ncbi:hypothetical protein CORC01_10766 [Colletotrichum orchidophilum]|uniref:Uncharacterized protein n=1 Tax=Colletotrichum orchidophilum TaxID=1209926 RepID=A0A1G4AXK5_9PEZI|nr:uncharacterized protein CORC01_10766 [Colletotrichum orchidophilum]OHE93867.1 hypothetical protein CORC01_10766 [Colletotrichum orchidophilum]